ncbi:MAG: hypothetical protein WCO79_02315 [bacterium]
MKLKLVGLLRAAAFIAFAAVALVTFTACQTMTVGKGEEVTISVDQPQSRIYLNNVLLSTKSYAVIKLDKSGGPYDISVRKAGYRDMQVKVTSKMNWRATRIAFVDNIFGVLKMGSFVYEGFTGGFKQLDSHSIRFELTPLSAAQSNPPPK